MSPLPDIDSLLPDDDRRRTLRDALVADLRTTTAPDRRTEDPGALTRRRFVRGGIALAGVSAVGLAGTAVVPGLRGTPVDVVASARAAAEPGGEGIVHALVRYHHGPYVFMGAMYAEPRGGHHHPGDVGRKVGTVTGDIESWSTATPLRHREVRFLDAPGGGQATMQTAYADGVVAERNSWEPKGRERQMGARERRRAVRDLTGTSGGRLSGLDSKGDPVTTIRRLLDGGRLREAGKTDLDGRHVRRLVGREDGYVDAGGTWTPPVDFEYLIDAGSYAPVRVTSLRVLAAHPNDEEPAARHERRIVDRWVFEVFERLPFTPETAKLLTIDGAGEMPSPQAD
ncbi:hypothetical protein AB0L40_04200 [Patulibacter sp. NPDC049589]|uniref:hypothetical protein n=1 Tax=Patulibacter sp. NPDC049589 TaxID=3154731 RepID=UPI003439A85B